MLEICFQLTECTTGRVVYFEYCGQERLFVVSVPTWMRQTASISWKICRFWSNPLFQYSVLQTLIKAGAIGRERLATDSKTIVPQYVVLGELHPLSSSRVDSSCRHNIKAAIGNILYHSSPLLPVQSIWQSTVVNKL